MKRPIAILLFAASSLLAVPASAQQSQPNPGPVMPNQHQQMMMGMGTGMMGMNQDAITMAEMGAIHALVTGHDSIKRVVTNLPDGIRTVTESDDPQIATLIKEHVASMTQRVTRKSDPNLPIESPALHFILNNGDKVRTTFEATDKGTIVIQTSTDRDTVAALQKHASELSDVVRDGMAALHGTMMAPPAVSPDAHDHVAADQSNNLHHADVNKKGEEVMGFDQLKTTHHFFLTASGGVIQVEANDSKDTVRRDQIRQHLAQIAQLFASGDFTAPMLIHSQTPPGVPVMMQMKADIQYRFEQTAGGGRVRITTSNPDALAAVHEFLLFQIRDHATGDSGKIEKP